MKMLNRLKLYLALCAGSLLLVFTPAAFADEIQDINKLFRQGQQEQALGRVNSYLAGKPKDAQARFLKGLILTEQGKSGDAIRVFSGLTEDYPELPEPYNNLAVLYASQGQYDKAKIALEMAIRTHPSYATAHENLGDIYAKMASQAYDRALQLDRNNAATQTKLALIKDLFSGAAKSGKPGVAPLTEAATVAAPQPAAEPAPAAAVAAPAPAPVEEKPAAAAPAPSVPEPAVPAAKQAAAIKPTDGNGNEVLKVVREWAAAWSSKDAKRYLAFYSVDFRAPGGEKRSDWEAQRRERIAGPKTISVGIKDARVKFSDSTHASVSFKQIYRASHLHNVSSKTLVMVKSSGSWLIQEERSGK
ncbi:MAG: tetratricopeptide repeat protein [Nitrosomonadales bacterium]|nr:tetratricopeptide repeat protein [Nitrosomonadales bacterium]